MLLRKLTVPILLLLSIISVQNPAGAQSFTTITNAGTMTSQTAQTAYSIFASATNYLTTTVSQTILDSTVQVSAPQSGRYCEIKSVNFDAVAHVQISGTFTATSKIQLYLLNDASYQAYSLTGKYCDPSEDNPDWVLVSLGPGTSFSWKWTPAADGTYWFFVENSDTNQSPTVHLLLVSEPVATTEENYVYATTENIIVSSFTQTFMSYQTQQIQNNVSSAGNVPWVAIIAIILIVASVVAVLLVRTRGGTRAAAARCAKCGAKLLPEAKFCKKCGAPLD